MATRAPIRKNLFGFGRKPEAKPRRGRGGLSLSEAAQAAVKAGRKSRDLSDFDSWLEARHLETRSDGFVSRVRDSYKRGVQAAEADEQNREFLKAKREQAREVAREAKAAARERPKSKASVGASDMPSEAAIQAGFKRGLSLAEILRGNPALRRNLVFSAQQLSEHEYDVFYKMPAYDWQRAGTFNAPTPEGAIARMKNSRWTLKGTQFQAKRTNPSKFDRCVKAVQAKGGAANAYAVCTAAGTRNPGEVVKVDRLPEKSSEWISGTIFQLPNGQMFRVQERGRGFKRITKVRGGLKKGEKVNPAAAAAEVFQEFHGFEPSEVITVTKKVHYHKHLAAAGELTHLKLWGIDDTGHTISKFKGAYLAFNEQKNQLFVEGGDQSVNLSDFGIDSPHELETLGRLTDIGYHTNKTHLGSEGGEAIYVHKFRTTNDSGKHVVVKIARYPDLIYDVRNEQLLFSGGSYEIIAEGIDK